MGCVSEYQCGGSSNNIAKALASETGWNSYSGDCAVGNDPTSNNATGFSAVPAGFFRGSRIYAAGNSTYFWSSTENSSDDAYCRILVKNSEYVVGEYYGKEYGFSVRCLRD